MDIFGSNLTQKGRNPVTPATVRAYSYTRYDKIGRIIEVGEVLTDQKVATYKNESQVQYASHEAFVGAAAAYKHQRSLTTYDRNETPPQGFEPTHLRNRVAYTTYQQDKNSSQIQQTHYSYDVHGNVNSLLQIINHDGNVLAKTVDYEYDLISGKVNKVYYQKKQKDQLIHVYAYDGDNRITEVKTSTDDVLYTKEATYQYYAHGPLARTTTGELNVETQNYAYTVQGWIKQMQAEAFSYALGYNEKDYTSIEATASILATPISRTSDNKSKGLYNGNIASMTSNTPRMTEVEDQPPILQQQYSYDQLNRITASNTPGAIEANAYKTSYSYDANGNIQTLVRYDGRGAKFDELAYNYENKAKGYLKNTNKLRWVDDIPELTAVKKDVDVDDQSTDNYSYDAIGNLIADDQEQIANIEWTVSGKVKRVTRTINSSKPDLEFEYDASGQRIVKKVIKKDGEITSTYYLRDASGNVMSVYVYNSLKDNIPLLSEQYLYGSSRIGVATPGVGTITNADGTKLGSRSFGRKSYELSDHLGNVRATLSDYRRLASQQIVNSATDYYPFGMVARSYSSSIMPRHGYGGQEKDTDIGEGIYTAEYWQYDSRLARRWNVDPRTYAGQSSYACFNNNPIFFSDPSGLEGEPTHKVQKGETFYSIGKKTGINYKDLLKWNGFTEETAKNLQTGATITLVDPNTKKGSTQSPAPQPQNSYFNNSSPTAQAIIKSLPNGGQRVVKQSTLPAGKPNTSTTTQPTSSNLQSRWYYRMFTDPDFGFGNDDGANQGGYMGGQQGWDEKGGKQLFFGTIGFVAAPFTIAGGATALAAGATIEGSVYIAAGTVSLLNGADDMLSSQVTRTAKDAYGNTLTTTQVESLTQSLVSDPNWSKNIGNIKVGATFITTMVGGYQLWQMGPVKTLNSLDGGATLVGVANDANSLRVFFQQ